MAGLAMRFLIEGADAARQVQHPKSFLLATHSQFDFDGCPSPLFPQRQQDQPGTGNMYVLTAYEC